MKTITIHRIDSPLQQSLFNKCTLCNNNDATMDFKLLRKIEETTEEIIIHEAHFKVCDECNSRYYNCIECSTTFLKSTNPGLNNGVKYVCNEHSAMYSICETCDDLVEINSMQSVNGALHCNSCIEEHFEECTTCGRMVYNDSITELETRNGYVRVCENCTENYSICIECETHFHRRETNSDICRPCQRVEREEARIIRAYDFRPRKYIRRYIDTYDEKVKPPLYGIEIEMVAKGGREGATSIVSDFHSEFDPKRDYVFCKEDGSLPEAGFEMVSHPWSLKFHVASDMWNNFLQYMRDQGVVSYNHSSCGIHIHRSKMDMGKMDQTKLGLFINEQQKFIEQIAQRRSDSYGKFYEKGRYKKKNVTNSAKYQAINFRTGRRTIELRVFKGSLIHSTVKGYLEFYDALCSYVKTASVVDVCMDRGHEKFIAFATKYRTIYPHLYKYMIRRKIINAPKYPKTALKKPWAVRAKREV